MLIDAGIAFEVPRVDGQSFSDISITAGISAVSLFHNSLVGFGKITDFVMIMGDVEIHRPRDVF